MVLENLQILKTINQSRPGSSSTELKYIYIQRPQKKSYKSNQIFIREIKPSNIIKSKLNIIVKSYKLTCPGKNIFSKKDIVSTCPKIRSDSAIVKQKRKPFLSALLAGTICFPLLKTKVTLN